MSEYQNPKGLAGGLSDGVGVWVPTDQRFPSHNETVLVWREGYFGSTLPGCAAITTFRMTGNGPKWDSDQNHWSLPGVLFRYVTHWMPLPAGPDH